MRYLRKEGPNSITHEILFDQDDAYRLFKNEIDRLIELKDTSLEIEVPSTGVIIAYMSPTEQDFPYSFSVCWKEPLKTDSRTIPSTPPPYPVDQDSLSPCHLKQEDLDISFFRSSSKVNMNDTACRIRHIPTGICGESKEKGPKSYNKRRALRILEEKLSRRTNKQ